MKSAFSLPGTVFFSLSLVPKPEGLCALVRVNEERADEKNFQNRQIPSSWGVSNGRSAAFLRKACPAVCAL